MIGAGSAGWKKNLNPRKCILSRQFQCIFILTKLPSDNAKIRIFEIVFPTYKVSFAAVNSYGLKRGLRWGSETFTLVIDFFSKSISWSSPGGGWCRMLSYHPLRRPHPHSWLCFLSHRRLGRGTWFEPLFFCCKQQRPAPKLQKLWWIVWLWQLDISKRLTSIQLEGLILHKKDKTTCTSTNVEKKTKQKVT